MRTQMTVVPHTVLPPIPSLNSLSTLRNKYQPEICPNQSSNLTVLYCWSLSSYWPLGYFKRSKTTSITSSRNRANRYCKTCSRSTTWLERLALMWLLWALLTWVFKIIHIWRLSIEAAILETNYWMTLNNWRQLNHLYKTLLEVQVLAFMA